MPTADPVVAHHAPGGLAATVLAALAAALELAGLAGGGAGRRVLALSQPFTLKPGTYMMMRSSSPPTTSRSTRGCTRSTSSSR